MTGRDVTVASCGLVELQGQHPSWMGDVIWWEDHRDVLRVLSKPLEGASWPDGSRDVWGLMLRGDSGVVLRGYWVVETWQKLPGSLAMTTLRMSVL